MPRDRQLLFVVAYPTRHLLTLSCDINHPMTLILIRPDSKKNLPNLFNLHDVIHQEFDPDHYRSIFPPFSIRNYYFHGDKSLMILHKLRVVLCSKTRCSPPKWHALQKGSLESFFIFDKLFHRRNHWSKWNVWLSIVEYVIYEFLIKVSANFFLNLCIIFRYQPTALVLGLLWYFILKCLW